LAWRASTLRAWIATMNRLLDNISFDLCPYIVSFVAKSKPA
jgi:hypothetical protein